MTYSGFPFKDDYVFLFFSFIFNYYDDFYFVLFFSSGLLHFLSFVFFSISKSLQREENFITSLLLLGPQHQLSLLSAINIL